MEKLINLLKERKGKWRKIAIAAGVSPSMVSRIMSGRPTNPSYISISRLIEACAKTRPTKAKAS